MTQHQQSARQARADHERTICERFRWGRLFWLLLIPLGMSWPNICAGHAGVVETRYAAAAYPLIRDAFSTVTRLVPFSVAEGMLYLLILSVTADVLIALIRWLLRRASWKHMLNVLVNVGVTAGVLINLFYVTWGFNYFRAPLRQRMELPVCARPVGELIELTEQLAAQAERERLLVCTDARGVATWTTDLQQTLNDMPNAYAALAKTYPQFSGRTTRAKRVLYSEGLSWLGIAGVYIGLTGEPNVNVAQPVLLIPQGAAHETAHQLGIASEDEAEFAGYLACMASDDPLVRYSGTVNALISSRNALRKTDPDAAEEIRARFSEGLLNDLIDYDRYWDAFDGPVEEAVSDSNDAYLKHNAQQSGIESYGESVDLLLAYYDLTKNQDA